MAGLRLALMVSAVGLALVAAACGGGSGRPGVAQAAPGSPTTSADATTQGAQPVSGSRFKHALAYSACVRKHGAPDFPDPNGKGQFLFTPGSGIDPSSPSVRAAMQACQSLLGSGGAAQATSPQNVRGLVKFAACMTKRGFPMSAGTPGSVSFPSNVNPNSPQFQAAYRVCVKLVPAGLP